MHDADTGAEGGAVERRGAVGERAAAAKEARGVGRSVRGDAGSEPPPAPGASRIGAGTRRNGGSGLAASSAARGLLLRILLPYMAFAVAWFLVVAPILGARGSAVLGGYQPWLFVVLSSLLLYLIARGEVHARSHSERTLSAALAAVPDAVAIVRPTDGRLVEANQGFAQFGYERSELVGRSLAEAGVFAAGEAERVLERLRAEPELRGMEVGFRTKDGTTRTVLLSARSANGRTGAAAHAVLVAHDVTEERQILARSEWQELHDPLTALPNRTLLLDRLRQALARARRRRTYVAVMALNLDRYRVVNESLGHETGDLLLAAVARRLVGSLRHEDTVARWGSTVSRLGGDEFTLVFEGIQRAEDARVVLRRIGKALADPFEIEGRELSITAGVGLALSPEGAECEPTELLRHAAIALRRAKERGLGREHMFDAAVDSRAVRRLRLEGDLREALDQQKLELHYQPIVSLQDGRIVGMESLMRWKHGELGYVSPLEIVPIAEESGLIVELGRWVLMEACRQTAEWNRRFPALSPLSIAVNVSSREIQEAGYGEAIAEVLVETGLTPASLELEITEGLMMQSLMGLRRLKSLEVRVAIDDFGTGYSSLAYLSRLPVDAIKIDKSFVEDLGRDVDAAAVGRAMVAMAASLGLDTIAEGIETEEQLAAVRDLGCTYGQGYYFSRPLRPERAEELLASQPGW